jgi:putative DNA-binding protein|nr:MAG TPA: regulatory protein [Caudoviricetes sp.]
MTQLSIINITMSSIDVAKLTEKEHRNVMADIRKLEEYYQEIYSAEKSAELIKSTTYKDSLQRTYPCYELSKEAVLDLITGYSLPHRHAVNKRWMELEAAVKKPLTPAQMLLGMAQQLVEHEEHLAQHDDRIKLLESENSALKEELKLIRDEEGYFTAKGAAQLHGIKNLTESEARELGVQLAKLSRTLGIEIKKTPHKGYCFVNMYHRDVVDKFFEDNDEE